MSIFFFIYLISLFCYIIKDRKKIDMFINLILNSKDGSNNINFESKKEMIKIKEKSTKNRKNEKKSNSKNKDDSKIKTNSKSKSKKKEKSFPPKKKKEKKEIKNKNKKNKELINSTSRNINMNSITPMKKKYDKKKINISIYPINNVQINPSPKDKSTEINEQKHVNKTTKIVEKFENLNDQELNSLEYDISIFIDKRTFCQYYWSLLKKKQLILFTILPANDYNLYSLKVALFLLSFSLYFTINGFFFTDSTMHKVNENNGKYDIILQIPQILYSSIISAIINLLLKILSLSEKNILFLKQEKSFLRARNISYSIKRCIIIKFVIFFILSNFLLLFFWYFISCFCAVYTNTQKILLKDTFISFAISMFYPFGINLLPGLFRIPALRDNKRNCKYMYKISGFIALI